ncbi:MAG: ATP synthase F1 subunit delta [Candidatus Limnocylindrales bacterium]
MTNRIAATRYARALLDVATKEQADLVRIETDLAGFVALLEQYPELSRALLNPSVSAARKRAAMVDLVTKIDVSSILGKLLLLLAERDRLTLLPDLLETYRQHLMDYRKIVRAEVTTAEPIAADRAQQIEQSLARATGRTVNLSTRVDPAIVGGLVARIGGTVYDASVTTHLKRLKQRLEESI